MKATEADWNDAGELREALAELRLKDWVTRRDRRTQEALVLRLEMLTGLSADTIVYNAEQDAYHLDMTRVCHEGS